MDNGSCNYRRFLDGDENGLVEIIRDYKDGLILYLNSIVNDLYTAEELAEDTFVKLGIKKPHDNGKSAFKTWLYTIMAIAGCMGKALSCQGTCAGKGT